MKQGNHVKITVEGAPRQITHKTPVHICGLRGRFTKWLSICSLDTKQLECCFLFFLPKSEFESFLRYPKLFNDKHAVNIPLLTHKNIRLCSTLTIHPDTPTRVFTHFFTLSTGFPSFYPIFKFQEDNYQKLLEKVKTDMPIHPVHCHNCQFAK